MRMSISLKVSTSIALIWGATPAFAAEQPASRSEPPAGVAAAQSAPVPADGAAQEDTRESSGLADIVVTAQRRSENLQKAAIAVTAVSADAIVRAGVNDTAQLTRIAPALQIGAVSGSLTQTYLRGVGNYTVNSLTDSAVSINLDGVPLVRSGAIQGMFYDLERIEVLKGPQGTLYGRNATGGAVNIITAKPHLDEFSGYINGEYGNFDSKRLAAAINAPVGTDTAIRIAGTYVDRDGFYSDGSGDDNLRAVRGQIVSHVTETLKVTVGGDYASVGGRGSGSTLAGLNRDDRIGVSDPRAGALYQQAFAPTAGAFLQALPNDSFQDNKYWGVFGQLDWETSIGTLTVMPSYRDADVYFRNFGSSTTVNDRLSDKQTTIEARFASDDSNRLSYLIGGFYLNEDALEHPGFAQQFFNIHGVLDSNTKSYAAFGRLTYKVTDNFRLSGTLRYTIDDKSAKLDALNILVVCPAIFAGTGNCIGTPALPNTFDTPPQFITPNGDPIPVQPYGANGAIALTTRVINNASKVFKKATYRLGFEYDLGPQSLLYGSYETGFKSGGFFSTIDDPIYKPETIRAFTVGSKNRFLGNRLQLNLEAFWWIYQDQQVSHFRLNSAGGSEYVTENIGKTRIRGFEVEARARVGSGTTINGLVQYLDAKYQDFIFTNPAANGPPVIGCPSTLSGAVYAVNCSGRRTTNAPKWTINAGIEQVIPLNDGSSVVFNVDGRYQSGAYVGFEQLPDQYQGGYAMVDAQVQYKLAGDQVSIGAFVNNLTDKNVLGFASPQPFAPSLVAQSLRPPRTYGVRVGYKF